MTSPETQPPINFKNEASGLVFPDESVEIQSKLERVRGLTLFDEQLYADVGRYPCDLLDEEEEILVIESFNARLKHLDNKIATFTRLITQKEYDDRAELYHENPELYAKIQTDNLKR